MFLGVNLLSREGYSQAGDRMIAYLWMSLPVRITAGNRSIIHHSGWIGAQVIVVFSVYWRLLPCLHEPSTAVT